MIKISQPVEKTKIITTQDTQQLLYAKLGLTMWDPSTMMAAVTIIWCYPDGTVFSEERFEFRQREFMEFIQSSLTEFGYMRQAILRFLSNKKLIPPVESDSWPAP